MKKIHKIIGCIVAVLVATIPTSAQAWGPERDIYYMASPASKPVFNSIKDNSVIGDERNFVRIVEAGSNEKYTDAVKVSGGKQYRVMVYYHNNASTTYNDKEHNHQGVAQNVRMSAQFPTNLKKNEQGTVAGVITSSNATPNKIWDEAYMYATEDVTIRYVAGSAKIYNQWGANGTTLPDALFSSAGTFLGMDDLNGMIYGCAEYSGQVVFNLAVESVAKPEPEKPEPVNPEEPEKPNPEEPTPEPQPQTELPSTGPLEIVGAGIIGAVVMFGVLYLIFSRKKLNKVQKKVLGKK